MRVWSVLGLMIVALSAMATHAAAEDIQKYEVSGEANAREADPRVAAIDQAFARALANVLRDVLDAETRKTHKTALDKEIIARARRWISGFKVIKDQTVDGRRKLTVEVRVDRDKLRARLEQLDIPARKKSQDEQLANQRAADAEKKRLADEAAANKKKAEDDAAKKKKLTEKERHTKAVSHFKQAEAFFNAKAYADAVTEYEAGLALESWAPALFNIGESLRLDGKRVKAIEAYKKYIEALPKGPRVDDARRHIAAHQADPRRSETVGVGSSACRS